MVDAATLRQALISIFGVDEKYVVPLDSGWYVPTYDSSDKTGTWIGYRILAKKPETRAQYADGDTYMTRAVKVMVRLAFVGCQAETLADTTLLWDERRDVRDAFGKLCNAVLDYDKHTQFSYPVANGGFNDNLCWCVDLTFHTAYSVATNYEDWDLKEVTLGGDIEIGG